MGESLKILIDTNVILDVLQKREPFYESSARVLALVESGEVTGCVTAHTLTTIFYLMCKDQDVEAARVMLTEL